MSKLKPCPFCGCKANIQKRTFGDNTGYAFVSCESCGASTKNFHKSLDYCAVEEAIKVWNRRTERSEDDQA